MKKIMQLTGLLACSFLIAYCGTNKSGNVTGPQSRNFPSFNPVVLEFGETKVLIPDELEVTFESILQESRCPIGVLCFWEGMAEIRLRVVELPLDTHYVNVSIYGGTTATDYRRWASFDTLGYRFTLLQLDPYPVFDEPVSDDEYTATLTIFPFTPNDAADGEVLITDDQPAAIMRDSFTLDSVWIEGETIHLAVKYSGGCLDHEFGLYMSPAAFMESYPAQANLYLRHEDPDDPCDAIIGRHLSFDVRPIAHLYDLMYKRTDPIALNVYHYFEGQPDESIRVVYHPEDFWWNDVCP